jgi:type VI secretion system protein ImpL
LLEDATARGVRVREMNKRDADNDKGNPLDKNASEKDADLNTLENLRVKLKELDDYKRNGAPFYMRFGMYSGDKLFLGDETNKGLFGIYADAVEQRFKKPMLAQLTADLQKFSQSTAISGIPNEEQEKELERNYKLLKAYLMLTGNHKGKAESGFLNEQLKPYWKEFSKNAPSLEALSEHQLAFFASQVDRPEFEAIKLDESLVTATRQRLKALPAWVKQYNNIISDVNKKVDPVGLDEALRGNRNAVYLQSSGYKVPGSFTEPGYKQEIYKAITNAREILIKPDWVMGETENNPKATDEDIKRLKARYFSEYTEQWRKFIQSVKVAPYKNDKSQAEAALEAFASAESPFNVLLTEVARNTNLTAQPKGWWSQLTSYFDGSADAAKMAEGTTVVTEFKPLLTFIGEQNAQSSDRADNTELSNYKKELNNLVSELRKFSQDELAKDLTQEKPKFNLRGREANVLTPLKNLEAKTSTKDAAELLKQPFDELKSLFGADVKSQIEKGWKNQLFPTASALEKGFPFTDSGETDLKKLTEYLNPANGSFSKFFETTLQKHFEDAGGGQWRPKESPDLKFNPDFVAYLNSALKLRDALYGKGAVPNFEYSVQLMPVKNATVELAIDGNKIDSEGTRSGNFTFPARSGQETGVVLQLLDNSAPPAATTPSAANTSTLPGSSNTNTNSAANPGAIRNFAQTNNNPAANQPLRIPGQWGIFHLIFDNGAKKNEAGEYVLNLNVQGKAAVIKIRPTGGDIFNREIFRLRAPQEILR